MTSNSPSEHTDILLIGAGVMSATQAGLIKELDPQLQIELFEVLDRPARESSNAGRRPYGQSLIDDRALARRLRRESASVLHIEDAGMIAP